MANDAKCAAYAELSRGVLRGVRNAAVYIIGSGVGGGIIIGGRVFEGGMTGGGEVGHQVVRFNGRQCTCGRKGCLEAYVSIPSLVSAAEKAVGRSLTPEEIFSVAAAGDRDLQEIVEEYKNMLGTGIVNIVNLFRPQAVLLGGMMTEQVRELIAPLREMINRDSFGNVHGPLPEIATAELGADAGVIGAANL